MAVTTTAVPLGGAASDTRETARASFRASMAEGARAMLPIVVGVAPFGMVIGVTAAAGPTSDLVGWATSWTIYAGSAQLAAIELLDAGATVPVILGVTLLINLRVALYSADLAPHWRGTGRGWKVLASYLIVDPSYAVGQEGYARHGATATGHAYYLGAALALWLGWQIEVAIGVLAGAQVPPALVLEFAVPLSLVALLARYADSGSGRAAMGVAAVTAVAAQGIPHHGGLPVAIVAGVIAGVVVGGDDR